MTPWMSATLLRFYPARWRARYGDELIAVIEADGARGGRAWLTAFGLLNGALRERLRIGGPAARGEQDPARRMRSGAVLVLCAWAFLVLGGAGVQRFSEHWQELTPEGGRGLASASFHALVLAGSLGCVLVALGILAALPALLRLLLEGGWRDLRAPAGIAVALTVFAVLATAGLSLWAHRLDSAQRNGADAVYSAVFIAWALLLAGTLFAWTSLAARCARLIALTGRLASIEAGLAVAVATAAIVATVASALWWAALAVRAPGVLQGRPGDAGGSVIVFPLAFDMAVMALGTVLATLGGLRCARGLVGIARG